MAIRTLFIILLLPASLLAQEKRFWEEIRAFQKQDSLKPPPRNAIVFVGSSSFRLWPDLQRDFPKHTIINRGFGGSSLPHVIEYAEEIIVPYEPKQVVIYCGENDFMTDTVTASIVVDRFKRLFGLVRQQLPETHILFVSMKPSPSRQHLMKEMARANETIQDFLSNKPRAKFVSVWDQMLKNGAPRKELFLQDMLHMNQKGYDIWRDAIAPHLR